MNKFLLILLIVISSGSLSLFSPLVAKAVRPFDFGGRVSFIRYCDAGMWVTVQGQGGGEYFYVPGQSAIKQYGPPNRIGQLVLGQSSGFTICYVSCQSGRCPIGGGFTVMPNAGSSQ